MNRLVIIGNGFDLAHGLPTSYKDFIDDYWRNIACKFTKSNKFSFVDEGNLIEVNYEFMRNQFDLAINEIDNVNSYINFKEFIDKYATGFNPYQYSDKNACVLTFRNCFFESICNQSIENWVDVENEYYKELNECLKSKDKFKIINLNNQFEQVKSLLEKYLIEKVEKDYIFSKEMVEDFIDIFGNNNYSGLTLDRFFMELSKKAENYLINEHKEIVNSRRRDKTFNNSLVDIGKHKLNINNHFLSFNYTSTVFEYIKQLNLTPLNINEIHGRLEDKRNLINFGFGDEMDKKYQEIEEKNDNEYLKNIKSFQYLNTPNYKRLLDLIDNKIFQVYIMGHSCGLSDRTLLNTIFEHENCCSIKVFYYAEKDKDGNILKDNYTEITQNISRHFNKKKLMREKLVNKTLCQPLPQIQLPKFKEN